MILLESTTFHKIDKPKLMIATRHLILQSDCDKAFDFAKPIP